MDSQGTINLIGKNSALTLLMWNLAKSLDGFL
jgi:hypothetical protein